MTRTIILATDDRPESAYAEMRNAAISWAAKSAARVVLYDRSAESYFVDPYPSGPWTADVDSAPGRDALLEPGDLQRMGRDYLADQVSEARRAGADAYAWLPARPGPAGMAEAVRRFGANLVILPAALQRPSLLDRVRGNTLDRFRSELAVEVATASRAGVAVAEVAHAG